MPRPVNTMRTDPKYVLTLIHNLALMYHRGSAISRRTALRIAGCLLWCSLRGPAALHLHHLHDLLTEDRGFELIFLTSGFMERCILSLSYAMIPHYHVPFTWADPTSKHFTDFPPLYVYVDGSSADMATGIVLITPHDVTPTVAEGWTYPLPQPQLTQQQCELHSIYLAMQHVLSHVRPHPNWPSMFCSSLTPKLLSIPFSLAVDDTSP